VPLVPRHGAGMFLRPRGGGPHERRLRRRQGGPGGAARSGRALHGHMPHPERQRRLAPEPLSDRHYYEPYGMGAEKEFKERLEEIRKYREG